GTPNPPRDPNSNGSRRQRGGGNANALISPDRHSRGGNRGTGRDSAGKGVSRGGWRRGGGHTQGQTRGQTAALRSRGPNPRRSQGEEGGDDGGQPPGQVPLGTGTFGDRLTGDAVHTEGDGGGKPGTNGVAVQPAEEDPDDGEVCFICASRVEHTS